MRYTMSLLLASLAATPALADVKVVTDIAPVQSLVAQVMGETGSPDALLPAGSDPHHFQMKPSQAGALQDAELVVWLGPEMTPWLDGAMGSRDGQSLQLLHVDGIETRQYGTHDHAEHEGHDHEGHDHAHEGHGHEGHHHGHSDHDHGHEGHDHAHEGHDHAHDEEHHHHEGLDPHAWLNPDNAIVWIDAIAAKLSELDPASAETYAANAAEAKEQIAALDAELAAQLQPVQDKPFVVFHDAYGYFTDHYGLLPAEAISPGDASSPSAQRLAAVRETASGCVFPETQHDPKLAQQVAQDAGLELGQPLDPEGSLLGGDAADLYPRLMRNMADTLTNCLN